LSLGIEPEEFSSGGSFENADIDEIPEDPLKT